MTLTKKILQKMGPTVNAPEKSDFFDHSITVSDSIALSDAYSRLTGAEGGTIYLTASDTPYWINKADHHDTRNNAPVLITSENENDPATVMSAVLKNEENVVFKDIQFEAVKGQSGSTKYLLRFEGADNVGVYDSSITSGGNGPAGTNDSSITIGKQGVFIRDSDGITFADTEFSGLTHALTALDSRNLDISNNTISKGQGDGLRFGGVQDVRVAANWIHSMYGSTTAFNHDDMIQIWGANASINNERITISGNILSSLGSPAYQGIFARNEDRPSNGWLMEDITLEHNVILGGLYHRISLNDTLRATVYRNTIIDGDNDYKLTESGLKQYIEDGWLNVIGSDSKVLNNIATWYRQSSSENTLSMNRQTREESEQSNNFTNIAAGMTGDIRDILSMPNSPWINQGSRLLSLDNIPDEQIVIARPSTKTDNKSLIHFDASLSQGFAQKRMSEDQIRWAFSDGTRKYGWNVEHDFLVPGEHQYSLSITDTEGHTNEITRSITISESTSYAIKIENGTASNTLSGQHWTAGSAEIRGNEIRLGVENSVARIGRQEVDLFNQTGFTWSATIEVDEGSDGQFMLIHRSALAAITKNGAVSFNFDTTEGNYKAITRSGLFDEGARHIDIVYSSFEKSLKIYIDGVVEANVYANGATVPNTNYDLVFGKIWGAGVSGWMSNIRISQEPDSQEVIRDRFLSQNSIEESHDPGETFGEIDFDGDLPSGIDFRSGTIEGTDENSFLDLSNATLGLSRSHDWMFRSENFDISFDAEITDDFNPGYIMYLHGGLSAELKADGRLAFSLSTSEGSTVTITQEPVFADGKAHRLSFGYDANVGRLQIIVDGNLAASEDLSGLTNPAKYWGLIFGHPWGADQASMRIDNVLFSELPDMRAKTLGEPNLLFDLDFDGTVYSSVPHAGDWQVSRGNPEFVEADGESAIRFDGDDSLSLSREQDWLYARDSFQFDVTISVGSTADQRVFHVHRSLGLGVIDEDFVFRMNTSEGKFTVSSSGLNLSDGVMRDVSIAYDDEIGFLAMMVDGIIVDQIEASGVTKEKEFWGLDIGTSWQGDLVSDLAGFQMLDSPEWHADFLT